MGDFLRIAIDGPAGAGKSTVAKMTAEKLGYIYIDTGAMYRAVTLSALMNNIDTNDSEQLTKLAENIDLAMSVDKYKKTRVLLNGVDVSEQIRSTYVSRNVAQVSQVPGVRRRLVHLQREMGAAGKVVMEGRDIGANVLPDAEFKFFLTASAQERAKRRYTELINKGSDITLAEVLTDIMRRDDIDAHRSVDPLKPACDAEFIDSTDMTIEQVVDLITCRVSGRLNQCFTTFAK